MGRKRQRPAGRSGDAAALRDQALAARPPTAEAAARLDGEAHLLGQDQALDPQRLLPEQRNDFRLAPQQAADGIDHLRVGPLELHELPARLVSADGWTVEYLVYDATRTPPLATRLRADQPPHKVRLAISKWNIE